jgi:hypothetical protein
MRDGEATLAWILFWVLTVITVVATFLITDHHRSRRLAVALTIVCAVFFLGLFFGLQAFLRYLGL